MVSSRLLQAEESLRAAPGELAQSTMLNTLVQTGQAPATQASQRRWSYKVPTALGMTESTIDFADDALRFTSDDVMGGSQTLPWASIRQGCTAAMAGMGGRGAPELPHWVPSRIEWLVLSRTAGSGPAFMRV